MNAAAKPQITIAAFENAALDPAAFDHEAHVYIAWLYLEQFPLLDATARFTSALQRLTAKLGIPDKYHETITWFFMFLIAERREKATSKGWFSFHRNNGDLFCRNDNIINRYYSSEILRSDRARQSFVMPDNLAS